MIVLLVLLKRFFREDVGQIVSHLAVWLIALTASPRSWCSNIISSLCSFRDLLVRLCENGKGWRQTELHKGSSETSRWLQGETTFDTVYSLTSAFMVLTSWWWQCTNKLSLYSSYCSISSICLAAEKNTALSFLSLCVIWLPLHPSVHQGFLCTLGRVHKARLYQPGWPWLDETGLKLSWGQNALSTLLDHVPAPFLVKFKNVSPKNNNDLFRVFKLKSATSVFHLKQNLLGLWCHCWLGLLLVQSFFEINQLYHANPPVNINTTSERG